jgi:hypothetical protein
MRNALIIIILLLLQSLCAAGSAQPLHYSDNEIYEFDAVLVQDSTIYVLGRNKDDQFLIEFDLQLNLQSKVKVFERLYVAEFLPYQDGFLTIERSNTQFTYINKQGELIDRLHLNGYDVIEFEKDGKKQIITRRNDQLYLYKINNDLSITEERLILEIGIERTQTSHSYELYFDETGYYIFYKNYYGIIRYSFNSDWKLYHQKVIIDKIERRYCQMKIAKNRIILNETGNKQFVYDFDGNLIYSGAKEYEDRKQTLDDIVFSTSESRDSLSIISPTEVFNFELLKDFYFQLADYAFINNHSIVLTGIKSYLPDGEMHLKPIIMILNNPQSELFLHQSSAADSIEAAYLADDAKRLSDLFSSWQMKNDPETRVDGEAYEREAYLLYSQVYPKLYKQSEKRSSRYHAISDEIEIILSDKITVGSCMYSSIAGAIEAKYTINERILLKDFHPELKIKKDIIYLDKQITKDILVYLSRAGLDDYDLRKRISFLDKYIHIGALYRHIGELYGSGEPDIYSQPQIVAIIFESDFERALVSYKKVYKYSSFFCHKKNGRWIKEKDSPFRIYEDFRYYSRYGKINLKVEKGLYHQKQDLQDWKSFLE